MKIFSLLIIVNALSIMQVFPLVKRQTPWVVNDDDSKDRTSMVNVKTPIHQWVPSVHLHSLLHKEHRLKIEFNSISLLLRLSTVETLPPIANQ